MEVGVDISGKEAVPAIGEPVTPSSIQLVLPYVVLIAVIVYLISLKRQRDQSYHEFLKNSPGIEVDTSNIEYGVGHGYSTGKQR